MGTPSLHYHLSQYICGGSCAKPSPFAGWATFAQIFSHRPDGCRYAIAQQYLLNGEVPQLVYHPGKEWICWDLLDDGLIARSSRSTVLLRPPIPVWSGPSEAGLIMKAMMSYGRA